MWMKEDLKQMNKRVQNIARISALKLDSKYRQKEFKFDFTMTGVEEESLRIFQQKMKGYRQENGTSISNKMIEFAITKKPYMLLGKSEEINDKISTDINDYIRISHYWTKYNNKETEVRYARNDDMMSIICRIDKQFIIMTESSFKNYLKSKKGKK